MERKGDCVGFFDYFDRLAIVHLPARKDRFRALSRELSRIGIDIHGSKVSTPDPPMPETSNGFTSRGVYGNFLVTSILLRVHIETVSKPSGC